MDNLIQKSVLKIVLSGLVFCASSLSWSEENRAEEKDKATIVMRPFTDFTYMEEKSRHQFEHFNNHIKMMLGESNTAFALPTAKMNMSELRLSGTSEPKVYGGTVVAPHLYPALFWYSTPDTQKCSSSQIGAKVIITAAHCLSSLVSNASRTVGDRIVDVSIEVGDPAGQSREITATCTLHPDYRWRGAYNLFPDWALCALDEERPLQKYETIYLETIPSGTNAQVAGYGCISEANTNEVTNFLTIGDVIVQDRHRQDSELVLNLKKGIIVTCPGDSGGPTYTSIDGQRVQIGVNALSLPRMGISKAAAFANQSFIGFLTRWTRNNRVTVCGLNAGAVNC